jgi:iron complex outermembrane receptor protein
MKRTVLAISMMAAFGVAHAAETDVLHIHKLTVTADPFGNRDADELISAATIIADEELERRKSTNLGETLDGLPGVSNSDFGPGVGRPVLRGLQGSRVQTLNNGLKVSDISGEGADHPIAIDTSSADQIEVIRGAATLLYGGNAAGGVINVKNRHFNPNFSNKTEVNGLLSYGENGNQRVGSLGLSLPLSDNFVIRADYSLQRSNDFDIDGFQQVGQTEGKKNTLQNSGVDSDSISITGLYDADWGFAALGYSHWQSDYGLPTVLLGEGEEEIESIDADYDRVDFRSEFYDLLPNIHTTRLKISYTDYYQAENGSTFHDGEYEESDTHIEFDNEEGEARLELLHNPFGAWEGVIGLQINHRDFAAVGEGHHHGHDDDHEDGHGDDHDDDHGDDHDDDHGDDHDDDHGDEHEAEDEHGHGGGFYVRENETSSFGLFALEKRDTSFGSIELAARLDYVDSSTSDLDEEREIHIEATDEELIQDAKLGDRSFTPFSISAGTIIDLTNDYHVRVSLSRSQRAPSPEQLYAFGEHHATGSIEIGDPNLGKETYTNFDIGLDKHHGPFTFNITAFYNQVSDYIYLQTAENAGQAIYMDGNLLVMNEQEDAKFYGAEFTSAWQLNETSRIRFSGDYVRAKLDNGGNLPRISPARLGVGFDTSFSDVKFSMDYRHVFEQDDTAELESKTDGYDLVSFDANWEPASLKGLGLFVKGRNLLDEDGRRHQSFLKDDAPITGRAFFAGIKFNFK